MLVPFIVALFALACAIASLCLRVTTLGWVALGIAIVCCCYFYRTKW